MNNSGVLKQGSSNKTAEEVSGNICKVEHILIQVTLESFGEREQNPCRFSLSKSYAQVKLKKINIWNRTNSKRIRARNSAVFFIISVKQSLIKNKYSLSLFLSYALFIYNMLIIALIL